MTDRSRGHEWANTIIAAAALLVAGAAAYFSWQANEMKNESLAMIPRQTSNCTTSFTSGPSGGTIDLCWEVTLANNSEDPISIIEYHVSEVLNRSTTQEFPGYQLLAESDGKPLALPINIDGGKARLILVRAPTEIPLDVERVIMQMPEYKDQARVSLSLGAVERAVEGSGLDLGGNKRPLLAGQWSQDPMSIFSVMTGRGARFSQQLIYYDPAAGWN
jgi:hypothetical protein